MQKKYVDIKVPEDLRDDIKLEATKKKQTMIDYLRDLVKKNKK